MTCMKPRTKMIIVISFGIVLVAVGVGLYVSFPAIMKSKIEKEIVLKEGSQAYGFWENIPIPIYLRIYFFNITNMMDIYKNFSKPVLEEVGPYTFKETREKVNISWDVNSTLYYRQIKRWYFEPDLSNGSLEDVITTINVPMIAVAAKAKKLDNSAVYLGVSFLFGLTDSKWFVHKPVSQLLFDGYEDELIDTARKYFTLPFDKFGWFYKRNGSDDGEFSIFSGIQGFDKYGQVNTWNGVKSVTAFDPPCNMIKGSAGDLWTPFRQEGGNISMFITNICRSISLKYLENRFINELEAYRYWADITQLDNGQINPDNKCFCLNDKCLLPGATDMSGCLYDVPALVSYPHFLYAHRSYIQGVVGLKPDPKKHMMYLDIQKEMGLPMEVAAKMQLNIAMEPIHPLTDFTNFTKTTYYPVFWFSESGLVDNSISNKLKYVIHTLPLIADVLAVFFMGTGTLLVMCALIFVFLFPRKKQNEESDKAPVLQHGCDEEMNV